MRRVGAGNREAPRTRVAAAEQLEPEVVTCRRAIGGNGSAIGLPHRGRIRHLLQSTREQIVGEQPQRGGEPRRRADIAVARRALQIRGGVAAPIPGDRLRHARNRLRVAPQ